MHMADIKDPYEYIPVFANHLDSMARVMRGFEHARELSAFLSGKRQLLGELQSRIDAKRDELAREEARTLDNAKAEAVKIIDRANTQAQSIRSAGHEAAKRRLDDIEAEISAKRAELKEVEARIATLKQSAAQFAQG